MGEQNVGQQDLLNAVSVLVKAAVGAEIAALRQSVATLESSVNQRLDKIERELSAKVSAALKEAADGINAARQELVARVDELRQALAKAEKAASDGVGGLQARVDKMMAELEQKIQKSSEQAATDMASVRDTLQKEVAALGQRTTQQIASLEARLGVESQARMALEREQKRVSTVLGTFARAFAGVQEPAPQPECSGSPTAQGSQSQQGRSPAASTQQGPSSPRAASESKGKAAGNEVALEELPNGGEVASSMDKLFRLGK